MKRLIPLMTTLSLGLSLMGQSRVPIISDHVFWEEDPPQTLEQLIDRSHTAAVVRIEGRTTALNSDGQVVVLYSAVVQRPLQLTDAPLSTGEFQFYELGGAFDSGIWIRQGYMQHYASLQPGGTYLVFLQKKSETEHRLSWGKYGAYEVLSGAVLPLCDASEALYKELAGLRLDELVDQTERIAELKSNGNASRKVR